MWAEPCRVLVLTSAGCAAAYLALTLCAFVRNRFLPRKRLDFTRAERLLIVAAHQDDETIIAGGTMMKTLAKGGEVHVVYTTDGAVKRRLGPGAAVQNCVLQREREARACLTSIGVPEVNISFLRYACETGLQEPDNVAAAINIVARHIERLQPGRIVAAAFEGGHCDHDISNYIVAKAAGIAGYPRERVFEAPEYNRYHLSEPILRRLNRVLWVKFELRPRFLFGHGGAMTLAMSRKELESKRVMFTHFASQDSGALATRFGFADQVRPLPPYRYAEAPFNPARCPRHRLVRLIRGKARSNPFYGMAYRDYLRLYAALEERIPTASPKREP